jgi:hypothetical protein
MVRTRRVQPDEVIATADGGEMYRVSREALMEAVADFVVLQDVAGGVFSCVVVRNPTGVPNEMVTTDAVLEWRDRTNAKPQPEASAPAQPAPAPEPEPITSDITQEDLETLRVDPPQEETLPLEPDGFNRSALEEEDESSIPAGAR